MLSLLVGAGLASCSSDDFSYTPAEALANAQVFFPTSNDVSYTLSDDAPTINIAIQRAVTDDALTVPLSVTVAQNAAAFTVPASVDFAAGEATAVIPVNYDPTQIAYESKDTLIISIGDETVTTPYGNNQQKMYVTLPSPLNLLGVGTFTDSWVWGGTGKVEIYQNKNNLSEFRVMAPFEAVLTAIAEEEGANPATYLAELNGRQSPYITFTVMKPGDALADIPITKQDLVYFPQINTGYYNTSNDYNQDILALHPVSFTNFQSEDMWTYSRVIEWQENGLPGRVQLAPYFYMNGIGGWNQTQNDGIFVIDFPGYSPKDYAAELTYRGVLTDPAGAVYAVGNLTLGADVTTAKAVVLPADVDADAVADALVSGDLEGIDVTSGTIEVPIEEGLTGKLLLIVAVIEDGAVKTTATAKFEYYGGGANPWQSLGVGYYTDDFVLPLFGNDPETFEVEIQESTETPGVYRLVSAYKAVAAGFGVDFTPTDIEVNAEDPDGVYILQQLTGVDLGYGNMEIASYGGYMLQRYTFTQLKGANYFGKLAGGSITFPTFTASSGTKYQGVIFDDDGSYYAGCNSAISIVLPSANVAVKAQAQARAKATAFAHRMKLTRAFRPVAQKKMTKRAADVVRPLPAELK